MLPLFALCALVPLTVVGDPTFDEGVRLYTDTEYEQAILRFEEVSVRSTLPPEDRAVALVWLGVAFASNSDFDGARRHFLDALRLDASAALPPNVSPRIVEVFDRAKAEAMAPPVRATPTTPAPPATPTPEPSGGNVAVAGIAGVAVGGAALFSGAMLGLLSAGAYERSTDDAAFADARLAAYDESVNLGVAGGVVAGVGAALLVGGGVALLVLE